MLTTTYEMLQNAYKGHYAVPAINTQGGTYDIIRAVCMAAEELRSPVILAHYVNTGAYSGHDWFYETAKWMAAKVSVPVAIHLDHGDSFERCMEMLKLGFTSIMFDGSALPQLFETVICRSCTETNSRLRKAILNHTAGTLLYLKRSKKKAEMSST